MLASLLGLSTPDSVLLCPHCPFLLVPALSEPSGLRSKHHFSEMPPLRGLPSQTGHQPPSPVILPPSTISSLLGHWAQALAVSAYLHVDLLMSAFPWTVSSMKAGAIPVLSITVSPAPRTGSGGQDTFSGHMNEWLSD